jgi:hypothetical protein
MASRTRLVFSAVTAAIVFGSALAYAEPSAAEKETARGLMTQGRAQRSSGDVKGALKSFQAADSIMHVPTTGYELAKTQEAAGLLVEARDTALRVARMPVQPDEAAPFAEARTNAQQLGDDLAERIPTLKITVTGAADGEDPLVSVDGGRPASLSVLGLGVRVDPGHHTVSAKTPHGAAKQEVDVAEKESKDVPLALVASAGGAPDDGSQTPANPPPGNGDTPPDTTTSEKSHALTYVGFGVAGAGVLVGTITGILTLSKKSSAKSGCTNDLCPPSTYDDIDSAHSFATVSTISFIVAGVGATVGVLSMLLGNDSTPAATPTPAEARVTPWIGLGSAGVRGTF